jgi:hypothetical protein
LELRENQPFVFVTKQQMGRNTDKLDRKGPGYLDVAKAVLTTFTLDLGKPATELKTMGTGGLRQADNNPGSYLFLTCADPATRRGVVAGWVTEDRGSGVLFSSVKEGKVEFKAMIDYGHLHFPDGQSAQLETLAIGCFADARVGLELYAGAIAMHYKIKLRPQIAGYCTWYDDKHPAAGDEKSIVELAAFVAKELKPFGFSFVQIDDEWQDGGGFNGPRRGFDRVKPNGPYPHGMGGAPDSDPYLLPSMMAGIVLAEAGYRELNFGPETPLELLAAAAQEHKASVVWLSVKVLADRAKLRREITELANRLNTLDTKLVVGGTGVESLAIRSMSNVHLMQTMTELAAFARGAASHKAATNVNPKKAIAGVP